MTEPWYEKYKVAPWLPEQESGAFRIERFEVTREGSVLAQLTQGGLQPPPGIYTRLVQGDRNYFSNTVMSDTPSEIMDHWSFFEKAKGRILIAGLGLGMSTAHLLREGKVEHMHIIEKSGNVIAMVEPALALEFGHDRFTIERADIFERKPRRDETYDFCWFDVWGSTSWDALDEMAVLHRRWTRRCNGNYESWWHKKLQAMKRRDREQERTWPGR